MNNLLLISLDCVRADVAFSGQFPTINQLRKKGVSFTNTISSAPLTPVSHATVLTGLQPYNHGIRHLFREQLQPDVTTIQQLFKKARYDTGAIVSCPGMNSWYSFSKGFDHYDDEIPCLPDGSDPLLTVDVKLRGTALKRGEVVTQRAIAWLKKRTTKPFFLFVHYFDAHWPYEAPKRFGGRNKYEEEVAYADHYLGELLSFMEKNGNLKNTTIVCFADHGEDLNGKYKNDKGGRKLGHPEEEGHGCLLYEQTQRIPLIILDKQLPKNKEISQQARLVDIFSTITDLFQLEHKKNDGESLIPLISNPKLERTIAYSETYYPEEFSEQSKFHNKIPTKKSIRIRNKYKVIFNTGTDSPEVFDLENDPNEIMNINEDNK